MRLLLIGVGSGASSCFNRLPDCNDWVKVLFLNNNSESVLIRADHKFNYRERISTGLDGGTILAKSGIARLHGEIIELVNESSYDAIIIICFMGGESAYGLENLVKSVRVFGNPVYLISSIPFAGEGKRKMVYMKECLDSTIDMLSGIYLLDLEEVIQCAVMTARGQTLLDFFRYCDTIILNFFNIFVSELENVDRNVRYVFLYDYLESELTTQKVSNIRDNLYPLL